MKKELKKVLGIIGIDWIGIATGVIITKIGEKAWEKVRDNIADDEEKIMETMKEIGEDEIEVIENTEE